MRYIVNVGVQLEADSEDEAKEIVLKLLWDSSDVDEVFNLVAEVNK